MRKILIISDSHGGGIKESIIYYFGFKHIKEAIVESKIIGNAETYLSSFQIDDLLIDVLILQGRSAFNFFNYLDLIRDKDYSDYEIYSYLGFNDLVPMKNKSSEKITSLRYIENLKKIFHKDIVVIRPLRHESLFNENPEYEKVYNNFIANIKKYSKMYQIEYINIYDLTGKDISKHNYWDEDHLLPRMYFNLIKHIEEQTISIFFAGKSKKTI